MKINEKIRVIRILRGMSLAKLSKEGAGSEGHQVAQQWELGKSRPDLANLAAVADCLGTTVDYLVRDDAAPAPVLDEKLHRGAESKNPNLITAEWSPEAGARIITSKSSLAPAGWDRLAEDERAALQALIDSVLAGLVILPNTKAKNRSDRPSLES